MPGMNEEVLQTCQLTDNYIKFTKEDANDSKLPFGGCSVNMERDGSFNVKVYRNQIHTDQYLQFDSPSTGTQTNSTSGRTSP